MINRRNVTWRRRALVSSLIRMVRVRRLQRSSTPTSSLPVAPAEPIDVAGAIIKIQPGLTDVRLADVLSAIVKVADKPITFSIEDYGVVFSHKRAAPLPLYTRCFRIDLQTLQTALRQELARLGQTTEMENADQPLSADAKASEVFTNLRTLLLHRNIDITAPGSTMFYSFREKALLVRAPMPELEVITEVIQNLDAAIALRIFKLDPARLQQRLTTISAQTAAEKAEGALPLKPEKVQQALRD